MSKGNSPSGEAAQMPAPATSKQGLGQGGAGCIAQSKDWA